MMDKSFNFGNFTVSRRGIHEVHDVVLINPPISQMDRYGKLAPLGNHLPNLGLAYLAAYLRQNGVTVSILDAAALGYSIEKTARMTAEKLPLIAGLTATTMSVGRAAALASKIKQYSPDTMIVLGGPHITGAPVETMETYRSIDYGVLGEGELTVQELFQKLKAGEPPEEVDGLIFRHKGKLVRTRPRALIPDLDRLPMPAWDLLPDLAVHYRPSPQSILRLPSSILCTSRGCPYRCAFCDRSVFGNVYRGHSPQRIYDMMALLSTGYGIRDISFHDEMFFVSEKNLVELCQLIRRNDLDITWSCQTRANLTPSDFSLRLMKEAGCWQLQFGLESGSNEMLRRMQKDLSVEDYQQAIARTSAAGIRTKAFIMLGYPGETEDTLAETEKFVLESDLNDIMIGFFTPYPGIEARQDLERHGTIVGGYEKQSAHFVSFVPNGLSQDALVKARNHIYRRFYLRPKVIRSAMSRLREPSARPLLLDAARKFWGATR